MITPSSASSGVRALPVPGARSPYARATNRFVGSSKRDGCPYPRNGAPITVDHAGNVEALVRLGELDARIAALQVQLQAPDADGQPASAAEPGSTVRIRFDDDPDTQDYLIGLVEQAGSGVEVITPSSPLGSVLLGARPGDRLSYKVANGTVLHVTLEEIAG